MMDKTFEPASVEARIAKLWDEAQAFRAGWHDRDGAPPYAIVIPPPNVTGSLHMGHALNNTLQDILCRFERMRGKDVLWQPGTDHAGIATQMVVERQLAERQQPGRREMGREAFLKRVWEWKEESGGLITNQLKRLGASCDWSRERFTMDEGLSKAVTKVFVALHRQGLIYRDKRLVNWDPRFQTAISDLEVVQVETKGQIWHLNYPLEGAVHDAENPETYITVATTRPETVLGDTAIAVHPDNDRLKHLIGRHAILPLVGRRIPIIGDDYADPEKGSGAVKITPAHDFNDFEVGKRHGLPLVNVLDSQGRLTLKDNAAFLEHAGGPDLEAAMALDGDDRFVARRKIVALFEARGLLKSIEPHAYTVPHGDRSNVVIEPWLTDQWYVDVKPLAERAMEAVRDGRTRFVPDNWQKTFFQWLENIEPWCVSRQLWWGHQIPVWYSGWGGVYVAETVEEAVVQALADAVTREIYDDVTAGEIAEDAARWDELLTRDEDVLDTWFSSALWPFSTLGWPDETAELKRYYPTSALVTGFDIIFFWVARMMMMGLNFMEDVPFRDVYIHALVRDEKGAKMSKSKGNVIDPLDLIDRFGADALRFTLAAMAAQGRDIKLSAQRVEGYRNFATKIWNAARFAEMNGCTRAAHFDPRALKEPINRWIVGEAARAAADVTAAVEGYKFNEAAQAAYRFVWNIYCDWYLELAKPLLMFGKSLSDLTASAHLPSVDPDIQDINAREAADRLTVGYWERKLEEAKGQPEASAIVASLDAFMPRMRRDGSAAEMVDALKETGETIAFVFDEILKLLHPFMPFLTEELWALKGPEGPPRTSLLALARWPALDGLEAPDAEAEIGYIVDLVSEVRSARSEMNVPAGALIPLVLVGGDGAASDRLARWDETIRRMARLSEITQATAAPPHSVQLVVRGSGIAMPLEGVVDFAAERVRLTREIGKLDAETAKIDTKLGNADFVSRAPGDVIDENRARREEAISRATRLRAALAQLGD